jgi:hypothetical protein
MRFPQETKDNAVQKGSNRGQDNELVELLGACEIPPQKMLLEQRLKQMQQEQPQR